MIYSMPISDKNWDSKNHESAQRRSTDQQNAMRSSFQNDKENYWHKNLTTLTDGFRS